jgi:AraC family transcriptional regulator
LPVTEVDSRPVVIDYKRDARPPLLHLVDRKSLGEITVCGAAFRPNQGARISTAQLVVAVHRSVSYELRWREHTHQKKRMVRPGMIHISPVGVSTYMEWGDAEPEIIALAIDQTMVLRIADSAGINPATHLPAVLGIRDPMIRQLAEACEKELNGANGRIFVESLITTLVTHIYRTYTSAGQPIIVKGGLTPKQISRVLAYVQDHLSENLAVDDLAAEVGLSGNHFTETFKRTLGVTPYKYILNQRIETAKDHLKQGKLAVAKIAEVIGFSSHTTFSSHFRKIVGVTPAQFRRESL